VRGSHLAKDNKRESILQAVKERVKQSEEHQLTQLIANAIGERRYRDLKDIISQIEQDRGWFQTLKHITRARNFSYALPIGVGSNMTPIENLKYREAIFTILDCNGFEPIPLTTEEVLSRLENEESLIDASQSIYTECKSLAIRQIESGDTLFFNQMHIDRDIVTLLEKFQYEEVANLSLEKHDNTIHVLPLWYCEKGRQALSQLGIKGTKIDMETFEIVISVIHQDIHTTNAIETQSSKKTLIYPSNLLYRSLLTSIINQDIENLCAMSSTHSYHTLKSILKNTLDHYEKHPSSINFRNILTYVNAHIRVRSLESIILLEELSFPKTYALQLLQSQLLEISITNLQQQLL